MLPRFRVHAADCTGPFGDRCFPFVLFGRCKHGRDCGGGLLIGGLRNSVRIHEERHAKAYRYEYEKSEGELEELTHRLLVHMHTVYRILAILGAWSCASA
jgi:hypothetical protein